MIENIRFIEDFIRITQDAWLKGWHERNGGNISYRLTDEEVNQARGYFIEKNEWLPLGITVENLESEYFLVSGSGKFFRNIAIDCLHNCGIIKIDGRGENYQIVWGLQNAIVTSELPSHLMSHSIKKKETNGRYRVIMHSHTTNIIALTFILPLDSRTFTQELWQMATECAVVFPSGVGVIEWMVPGSVAIGVKTGELMKKHDLVVWAHHGLFAAGETLDLTFGLMDTAEKSAEILVKVLSMGGKRQTISNENLLELAKGFRLTLPEEYFIE